MASSEAPPPSGLQDWEYVKQGIALWLNNQPKAAEESFKNRESSVHIVAGHTFISFMHLLANVHQVVYRQQQRIRCSLPWQ
ncbi:hypothetical protein quinque_001606 [Culex quinquefasciatus]